MSEDKCCPDCSIPASEQDPKGCDNKSCLCHHSLAVNVQDRSKVDAKFG